MLQFIIEYSILMLLMLFLFTQLAIPAWKGTQFFPLFRRKYKNAEEELMIAQSLLEAARLEKEAKNVRDKITSTKKGK